MPGLNVTQISARDVNFTTRGATSTLATSQLALVDGRSVYLDFFGMVMWDLVPTNPERDPADRSDPRSGVGRVGRQRHERRRQRHHQDARASWPRRAARSLTIGVGAFNRNVDRTATPDAGSLFYVNGSHAQAVNDRWAFKLSAGYLTQDPLPRPTGTIPNAFSTPYPPFTNEGTSQPKFDARVDYDIAGGGTVTFSGGVAGTEGIIHSGIGPFDISSDSRMTYFTTRYQKGGRRIAFFTNLLDGDAVEPAGARADRPAAAARLRHQDVRRRGQSDVRRDRHAPRADATAATSATTRSTSRLRPDGDDRNEGGGFLQDEIFLGDHFRWVVGGRVDKFSSIDDAVFSPRTTFMVKPDAAQTFRVSFNRAFRAPSFINNHIETTILNEVNLSALSPALARFVFPIRADGNPDLKQETMTAYEIGYTGVIRNRATVSAAVYWNNTEDGIYFTPDALLLGGEPAADLAVGAAAAGRRLPAAGVDGACSCPRTSPT